MTKHRKTGWLPLFLAVSLAAVACDAWGGEKRPEVVRRDIGRYLLGGSGSDDNDKDQKPPSGISLQMDPGITALRPPDAAGSSAAKKGDDGIIVRSNPRKFRVRTEVVVKDIWKDRLGLLLYLPYPESNAFQEIEHVNLAKGEVTEAPVPGDDKFLRVYFSSEDLAEILPPPPADAGKKRKEPLAQEPPVVVTTEYIATLYDFHADFSKITQLHPYDTESELYKAYTEADGAYIDPDNSEIQKIVEDLHAVAEDDMEFIRLAFRYAKDDAKRSQGGGGRQTLAQVLKKGGGAVGINMVFVSLLRGSGIPARLVVARRINKANHVWSEFYLEKYGWIPADPSIFVPDDQFFGKISLTFEESRNRSQAPGIILNHLYGDAEFPVPESGAPLKSGALTDCLFWGVYSPPKYNLTITPEGSQSPAAKDQDRRRKMNLQLR